MLRKNSNRRAATMAIRGTWRPTIGAWLGGGIAIFVLAGAIPAAGAAESADDAFSEQLASGEFAPALRQAEQSNNSADRDRLFSRVATAQSESGDRRGAISTLRSIGDDLARGEVASNLSQDSSRRGARGGAAAADFDSLIELITATVAPDSWDEAGGDAAIQEYRGGIYVDSRGTLNRLRREDDGSRLATLRTDALVGVSRQSRGGRGARHESSLRKISLNRLEREIQLRKAEGRKLDEEMLVMAGLQRIQYVMVYPETNDLVIAGPAGDWTLDQEDRFVSVKGNRPVARLDDLVVVLRHVMAKPNSDFGCSIDPTREGLAALQSYVSGSQTPLKPGAAAARAWSEKLRDALGSQTARIFGVDPTSRTAQVLLEADYRMKLVGLGLEPSVSEVPSYLDSIEVGKGKTPPPMEVVRWWFTMNYDAILADKHHNVFELRGQGVKVMCESELLAERGQRLHTGDAQPLYERFARNFTEHFESMAVKYPIYAEMRNIFDLSLVCSLIESEGLADRIDWHMSSFRDPKKFQVARGNVPRTVPSAVNHRVIPGQGKSTVFAVPAGGVSFRPSEMVAADKIQTDKKGGLGSERDRAQPRELSRSAWWWD